MMTQDQSSLRRIIVEAHIARVIEGIVPAERDVRSEDVIFIGCESIFHSSDFADPSLHSEASVKRRRKEVWAV